MSDLLSSLASAARALDAQRYGLDVAGQNIANVNTPGYTRRTIELSERLPVDDTNAGGGVDVVGITAARAPLLDARLFHEHPGASREAAVADQLTTIQGAIGAPGSSLDASLAVFYGAFTSLAEDPTSSSVRQRVVASGQALARSFLDLAARLSTSQRDADAELRGNVDQVNGLARQIASLNASIIASVNGDTAGLQDQRTIALKSLSSLIDIGVIQRSDGGLDVAIGNGRALVTGTNASAVSTSPTPPQNLSAISVGGADVTAEISGGRIGGLLRVRDVLIPGYARGLDQLAYGVATDVNTRHRAGYDLDQNAGTDLFTQPASIAGAASSMAVNGAVVANTRLVAAAGAPVAGDNQNARALAALGDANITGGTATPVDSWGQLVYRIGSDAQAAQQDQSAHDRVIQQLETMREQISGVSLDEEATMMLRFQRAYEANARFFSAVSQSLDVLMATVGR
jgi:flagellar hook-associated protein 1 FlgK